jgi:hypothetical protein
MESSMAAARSCAEIKVVISSDAAAQVSALQTKRSILREFMAGKKYNFFRRS